MIKETVTYDLRAKIFQYTTALDTASHKLSESPGSTKLLGLKAKSGAIMFSWQEIVLVLNSSARARISSAAVA